MNQSLIRVLFADNLTEYQSQIKIGITTEHYGRLPFHLLITYINHLGENHGAHKAGNMYLLSVFGVMLNQNITKMYVLHKHN